MDWDKFYSDATRYSRRVAKLDFESRPAKVLTLERESASTSTKFSSQLLTSDNDMQDWLKAQALNTTRSWPAWYLTVLLLTRGPPNEFEETGNASAHQLSTLGCSKQHFQLINETFAISKAFPSYILSDQACYSKRLEYDGASSLSRVLFNVRSSQAILRDSALSLVNSCTQGRTFALVLGCTNEDMRKIELWLTAMKESGGHPLLFVGLFLEFQHRSLTARYRELRRMYFNYRSNTFGEHAVTIDNADTSFYREIVSGASQLDEDLDALDIELTAFGLRLPDVVGVLRAFPSHFSKEKKEHMELHGQLLVENLDNLRCENEYLQAKTITLGRNTETLISSLWNVITMNENQISKEIATASKRDSTVMSAITIGTLFFFPGTFVATMFAMPLFNWTAKEGENVTEDRFWIYWAVTVPLTIVVLGLLFFWFRVQDQHASESKKEAGNVPKKQEFSSWLSSHALRRRRKVDSHGIQGKQSPPGP